MEFLGGYPQKMLYVAAEFNGASFAYERLKAHHLGAKVQMSRLNNAFNRRRLDELQPDAGYEARVAHVDNGTEIATAILCELHFYFVAWSACGSMLRIITKQPEFFPARKLFDRHRWIFDTYRAARDSFEHFHDRLPGERDHTRMRETRQTPASGPSTVYWGIDRDFYRHSDLRCDISPSSLTLLDQIVSEVLASVHETVDRLIADKFPTSKHP